MADEDRGGEPGEVPTTLSDATENALTTVLDGLESLIEFLELLTAMLLVVLFAIGLFDLVVALWGAIESGAAGQVETVISFIDTVLLLLIIAEVFRTVVAFSRQESTVRIIIDAALIAIVRKIITFRPDVYPSYGDAFTAASSIVVLLLTLLVAFYVVRNAGGDGAIDLPAARALGRSEGEENGRN